MEVPSRKDLPNLSRIGINQGTVRIMHARAEHETTRAEWKYVDQFIPNLFRADSASEFQAVLYNIRCRRILSASLYCRKNACKIL